MPAARGVSLSSPLANRFPEQLSGGERQRVAIARALAAEPEAAGVRRDHLGARRLGAGVILLLLRRLRDEMGLTLLFITHDLALTHDRRPRRGQTDGRIVEEGPPERHSTPRATEYTRKPLANTLSIEVALGHVAAPAG